MVSENPDQSLSQKEIAEVKASRPDAIGTNADDDDEEPEEWSDPGAWELLLYAISAKKCTPFLGAGASAEVLPLAKDISQRLARKYGYPFSDSGNLSRVAQFVGIMRGATLPGLHIQAEFKDKHPEFNNPDEPHRVLAELELPIYITTNYDSFMFDELKRQGKRPIRQLCKWHTIKELSKETPVGVAPVTPTPETPVVYHLHGNFTDENSLVLTEDDYLNFLVAVSEVSTLIPSYIERALAPDRVCLFIGYSLEDMSFKVLFRKFERQIASSPGVRHVAVQLHSTKGLSDEEKRKQREFLQKLFWTRSVQIYWGKASNFLRSLREHWRAFEPGR